MYLNKVFSHTFIQLTLSLRSVKMKLLFLSVVMMISASVIYADDAETVEGAFASFKVS